MGKSAAKGQGEEEHREVMDAHKRCYKAGLPQRKLGGAEGLKDEGGRKNPKANLREGTRGNFSQTA